MEHIIVTGLGFGDEGKGSVVDYLVRHTPRPLVVRYNGGCQAGHNVVTPEGKHHTFSQFGSGTLAGVDTYLSKFTILNPANMVGEEEHLRQLGIPNAFDGLYIAESALIITPYHREANRLREKLRGDARHGSCGQGIGETVHDSMRFPEMAVRARDLRDRETLERKFKFWREVKNIEFDTEFGTWDRALELLLDMGQMLHIVGDDWLEDQFDHHTVIFEGAQGVLLDQRWGFHPHTTWSNTTSDNAWELLNGREAQSLGVIRTYMTRHGAGPFVTEMSGALTDVLYPEPHNDTGEFQGSFRIGALDLVAIRYALSMCSKGIPDEEAITGLAVTHMDRVTDATPCICAYDIDEIQERTFIDSREIFGGTDLEEQAMLTSLLFRARPRWEEFYNSEELLGHIEDVTGIKIVLESHGPTASDKRASIALPV